MKLLTTRAICTTSIGLMLFLVGCGGHNGNDTNTANTGTDSGTLADLLVSPAPGSVFISKSSTFQLTWSDGTTPPPTFTVSLQRYDESTDSSSPQKTDLVREGDSYTWDLSRSNDFTLDSPAVYYLDIESGSELVYSAYIVSGERSESLVAGRAAVRKIDAAVSRAAADSGNNSDTSAFVHTVVVGKGK